VNFSKEVTSIVVVEQQNSDRLAPLKKKNKEDDEANKASGSVSNN
jgi:hypothetical protein